VFLRSEIILYSNFIFQGEQVTFFLRTLLRFAVFFVGGHFFLLFRFIFPNNSEKETAELYKGWQNGSLLQLLCKEDMLIHLSHDVFYFSNQNRKLEAAM